MTYKYIRKFALGLSVLLVVTIANAYPAEPTKQPAKSATKKRQQDDLAEALRLRAEKKYIGAYAITAPLAEKGNPAAMVLLSELFTVYDSDQKIAPDWNMALNWLERAARKNYPPAMSKLGHILVEEMFAEIYKIPPDMNRGVKLIIEAEKLGDTEALSLLGTIYSDGKGVPVDKKEALRWYEKEERVTGKKSTGKEFMIRQDMNSRIGTDVCKSAVDSKSPKMKITLDDGRKIDLIIAGTIVARSDSHEKVAMRINSIKAIDEMGAKTNLLKFTSPGETYIIGQENWEHTVGLVPCY